MSVKELSSTTFDQFISKGTVLVELYQDHCPPCKMMYPELEKLSEKSDKYKVAKCAVDVNPDISERFDVMSTPTILVFKNGEVVDRRSGYVNVVLMEDMLK